MNGIAAPQEWRSWHFLAGAQREFNNVQERVRLASSMQAPVEMSWEWSHDLVAKEGRPFPQTGRDVRAHKRRPTHAVTRYMT